MQRRAKHRENRDCDGIEDQIPATVSAHKPPAEAFLVHTYVQAVLPSLVAGKSKPAIDT